MSGNTLLINGAFALKQQNGAPIYTEVKKVIIPHSKEFIEKHAKHFEKLGLKLPDGKQIIKTDHHLDLHKLERIIITSNGKGYISTYFLDFMKEFNVPIYFVNRNVQKPPGGSP